MVLYTKKRDHNDNIEGKTILMQLIFIQILYVMNNTLASINYKGTQVSRFGMNLGFSCSKGMLGFTVLDECCLPSSFATTASFLSEKPPMTTVPICDDMPIELL
jgi:hypothetical protein